MIVLHLLVCTAAIGIVAASMFVGQIPAYMTIVSCGIIVCTYLLCMRKRVKKC